MSRTRSTLWNVLIPLVISVALSVSAYFLMIGRLMKTQRVELNKKCAIPWTGDHPVQRNYLGGYYPQLDRLMCIYVAFFEPMFRPEAIHHSPFFYDTLASLCSLAAIPLFEAYRTDTPLLLAFPTVVLLLSQAAGMGVIIPLYFGLLLATVNKRITGTKIDQASAEAILFGIGMGYVLPTLAMWYFSNVESNAVWQLYPIHILLFQYLHLFIRPRHLHPESGHRTVQATWMIIFLVSTASHIRALSAYNFDPKVVLDVYFPTIAEPKAGPAMSLISTIHFFQWDVAFMFGSPLLMSLWFAENILEGALLVIWNTIATLGLGPGAAIAGIFLWRESKLNQKWGDEVAQAKASKSQ